MQALSVFGTKNNVQQAASASSPRSTPSLPRPAVWDSAGPGRYIAGAAFEMAALAVLLGGFFLHARLFEFIQDDSFITFRFIRNFTSGGGLVFNTGEYVEGYTSLLWALVLAAPAKLGLNLVISSRYIGVGFGLAALYLLYRLSRQIAGSRSVPFMEHLPHVPHVQSVVHVPSVSPVPPVPPRGTSETVRDDERRASGFSLIAVGLMAANGAAAYWSISGMETALF
ncbi:MAG: hypothetical protein E6K56_04560, partial [Ignavibacteria bacterium]